MKKCQTCGFELAENTKFCGKCGSAFLLQMNICKVCNTELPENAKFCGKCGTSSLQQNNICKGCGTELSEKIKFCGKCGMSHYSAPSHQNTPSVLPPAIKGITRKPAFWIASAAALVIVFFIVNTTSGTSQRNNYTQGNRTGIVSSSAQENRAESSVSLSTPVNTASGTRQAQLRVVIAPPAKEINCRVCDGTRQRNCQFCDGTGKEPNPIDSSFFQVQGNQMLNELMILSGLQAFSAMCLHCNGSGKAHCDNSVFENDWFGFCNGGKERNPNFNRYVATLDYFASESSLTIFELEPGYNVKYIGIKLCSSCNGNYIYNNNMDFLFMSFNTIVNTPSSQLGISANCNECYAGQSIYFPSSVNDVQPFRSSADINSALSAALRDSAEDRYARHQQSMDRQRQIMDELLEKQREIHNNRFRECARYDCRGPAMANSSHCSSHQGIPSNTAYCNTQGCTNRLYSNLLYCSACQGR